jgi:carboxy-terminal domain RNA polymerase II polypeptide A small phosphatase
MIPNAPIVITAPSTPAYNSFDLDPDPDTLIPPTPKGSHLLPVDETEGVTSGAVQPPGSTAHPDKEESDRGTFTDDEFHDAKDEEEHIDAEELRLIMNAGSGIPIVDGKPKPLLPPLAEHHRGRKCLVRASLRPCASNLVNNSPIRFLTWMKPSFIPASRYNS